MRLFFWVGNFVSASTDSFWSGTVVSIYEVFRVFVSRDTRCLCVVFLMGTVRQEELHNQPFNFLRFILLTRNAVVRSFSLPFHLSFKDKPSLLLWFAPSLYLWLTFPSTISDSFFPVANSFLLTPFVFSLTS